MAIKLIDPDKFRKLLREQGFTQRSFAEKAAISPEYVNMIINEKYFPGPKMAKKICDTLDLSFDDLFFITD